jgi:tartrate dehydrogenase/decarboxylase/D-malate dehydrogenase
MTRQHRIAVIAGDGIGQEVMPEGIRVVEAAGRRFGISFLWDELDWSCDLFRRTGRMMPEDGLERIREHDAIFLGAVGYPGVPDHVSLWGLLIPIRRGFDQYANVRPVRLMPGVKSPLTNRKPSDIDMLIVRENTEGEYSSTGAVVDEGTDNERAVQESVFTRKGVDRILRFAFEAAEKRRGSVTSATKSNGIAVTMPYWDKRFAAMAEHFPKVKTTQYHIDILTAQFVRNPQLFDVVVGSNLFGDILSDLGPACAGTIAIAPSANINPERTFPSMFEPVHGSAPDIFGRKIANPIGQIWSGAMMLEHLGHAEAAAAVVKAIETVLQEGPHSPDLCGKSSTEEVGKAIAAAL